VGISTRDDLSDTISAHLRLDAMWSLAQFCAALALGGTLVACGGDEGSSPADDAGASDGSVLCGDLVCEALSSGCGAGIDGCGERIDCGSCRFTVESVSPTGGAPAIAIGDVPTIAYPDNAGGWAIRVARRESTGWVAEPVVALAGEPAGPVDLAIGSDGTRWVVYSDDTGTIWVAHAQPGATWTIEGPLATGTTAAIDIDGNGEPLVGIAGLVASTSGVFVAVRDAGAWTLSPVGDPATAGVPRSLAVVAVDNESAVVWRDPADGGVRYARGRASAYSVESVMTSAATPSHDGALSLAFGPFGRPHVVFGVGTGQLIYAVRSGELWEQVVIAGNHADRDDAFAIDPLGGLHVGFFAVGGLHVAEGLAGAWLADLGSGDCYDGDVDLALDLVGELHVAYRCGDGVHHLVRAGPL